MHLIMLQSRKLSCWYSVCIYIQNSMTYSIFVSYAVHGDNLKVLFYMFWTL